MKARSILLFTLAASYLAAAAPVQDQVSLGAAEQKKLNIFFSNFSEVFLEPFSRGKIKDSSLIDFGVLHNIINNPKRFTRAEEPVYQLLAASHVEQSINKYFGISSIKHQSTESFSFAKGQYKIPLADGEAICFSQLVRLIDNHDGTYRAYVNNYEVPNWVEIDPHASPETWPKIPKEEAPVLSGRFVALIKKTSKSPRYILLEYLEGR